MATVHVRNPLPRKGGNSFYRDTRDGFVTAYVSDGTRLVAA